MAELVGLALQAAVPYALAGLGFTASGIAAGSAAAAYQSIVGNVAAGSIFSVLQSTGAAGIGAVGKAVIGAASQVIVLVAEVGAKKAAKHIDKM